MIRLFLFLIDKISTNYSAIPLRFRLSSERVHREQTGKIIRHGPEAVVAILTFKVFFFQHDIIVGLLLTESGSLWSHLTVALIKRIEFLG